MKPMIKKILACILLSICSGFVWSHPSLEPSVLIQFPSDYELSSRDIIVTALEYSLCPVESTEGQLCLKKYDVMEKSALRRFSKLTQEEQARQLLEFMYEGMLYKYVEHSTKLNTTLLTGEYNCVTASILYLALTQALGIDSRGQEATIHAFVTVYLDGKPVDVETTNPYGFNPGEKKLVQQTEDTRKYSYVPKKYYAGRREVSLKAFATLPGKNLAADLNDVNGFDEAIPLDISRWHFLKGDKEEKTAIADLDVLISNYCLLLSKKKQARESTAYLTEAALVFGMNPEMQKTYDNSVYNGCVDLLNGGQIQEARQFFESNKYQMTQTMATKADQMVTSQQQHLMEVEVHNSIVPLFNSGRYEEARQILEEALKNNPTSATLKKDLSLVKRALQQ